jgi:hypothetical protein
MVGILIGHNCQKIYLQVMPYKQQELIMTLALMPVAVCLLVCTISLHGNHAPRLEGLEDGVMRK